MKDVVDTMNCETAGTWDPKIQSADRRPDGSQELSFGLAQIYLPKHPDISIASATDPDFAVEYMVKNFKKGHQKMWTCYQFVTTGTWWNSTTTPEKVEEILYIEPSDTYTSSDKYCLARFKFDLSTV